ncbi:hypothetical protein GGS20DRAFT_568442 [Poronia punctata]|nr:hypothetical protein GGS20DRAFT_568442 [Poronia punctata]
MEPTIQEPRKAHASPRSPSHAGSNPNSQKRARDYGAELKGLGSSGDETSPNWKSSSYKRRRKNHETGNSDDGAGDSSSEDLDDGEIVESPQPAHTFRSVGRSPPLQPAATSDLSPGTLPGVIETKTPLGADNPQKAEGVDGLGGRVESSVASDSAVTVGGVPKSSFPGWNQGIAPGIRTSFGTKPVGSFQRAPASSLETTAEKQADEVPEQNCKSSGEMSTAPKAVDERIEPRSKKERKRARELDRANNRATTFEASNSVWQFPSTIPEISVPEDTPVEDSLWTEIFKMWVSHLVQANRDVLDRLTYKVVRAGWVICFTKKMGLIAGNKKHLAATRLVSQDFMTSLTKEQVNDMISDATLKVVLGPEPGGESASLPGSPSPPDPDEQLRLQSRYFGSAEDPSQYCLSCSGLGHSAHVCPELNCRFCNGSDHTSYGCPTKHMCGNCHQIGHSSESCEARLRLAPEERSACTFCGAAHRPEGCPEIWRTFKSTEIKKVKSIPAFCYQCGYDNHYGPECSLSFKAADSAATLWSRTIRDIYVDPNSEDVAIAWADFDPSQLEHESPGEFHVPGQATRKTHTYFVSSDESEEELVHAPVKKKQQPRGEIRIASNIGNIGWGPSQPPLPPGPPPGAARAGQRSFQQAPSGTLPPRPQGLPQGRSAGGGNGGPRGRGGFRGRGRGRGHGRGH